MQFLLYCICGGIGVSTDYSVYYFALKLGAWYQVANVFGYVSGTVVSFILNRKITFSTSDKIVRRLVLFLGVAALGFSVSAAMLWLLVDYASVDTKLAKLFTLPVVVILQYSLNRKITFREYTKTQLSC